MSCFYCNGQRLSFEHNGLEAFGVQDYHRSEFHIITIFAGYLLICIVINAEV